MAACALIVAFHLQPGKKAEFLAIMNEHAKLTLAREPGCQRFDVLQPDGDDSLIQLYELYDDRAAYEAHRLGPRMPGINAALEPLITGRKVTVCTIL